MFSKLRNQVEKHKFSQKMSKNRVHDAADEIDIDRGKVFYQYYILLTILRTMSSNNITYDVF